MPFSFKLPFLLFNGVCWGRGYTQAQGLRGQQHDFCKELAQSLGQSTLHRCHGLKISDALFPHCFASSCRWPVAEISNEPYISFSRVDILTEHRFSFPAAQTMPFPYEPPYSFTEKYKLRTTMPSTERTGKTSCLKKAGTQVKPVKRSSPTGSPHRLCSQIYAPTPCLN